MFIQHTNSLFATKRTILLILAFGASLWGLAPSSTPPYRSSQ